MKILQIDPTGKVVGEYHTIAEAVEETGLDRSHISKCLRGIRYRHGGYKWKWTEEDVCNTDVPGIRDYNESKTYDYQKDSAVLSAKTERSITSLQEAIDFFEIDMEKWSVERFIVNSWDVSMKDELNKGSTIKRTNYQVKLWLKPREITLDEVLEEVNIKLEGYKPKSVNIVKGKGVITAEFSDFHIGAEIKDLVRTKDFNVKILSDYLYSATEIINSYKSEKVVVNLHGDFFESISGLNHDDTWKSLGRGMFGANIVILASKLLVEDLLANINNLAEVNIVSGNHDRISAKNTMDKVGEGGKLLAWIINKDLPKVPVNYNPLILVREIDGVNHIKTHGHHGISKRDLSKVVFDYGNSSLFNLWSEGHLHTRITKKVLKKSLAKYDTIEIVNLDDQKYRKVVLPPMFTGNYFSESLGYASNAGFAITFNNGKGIPNIHDYTL